MRAAFPLLLLLAACDGASSEAQQATASASPCETRYFEESRFTVCAAEGPIEIVTSDESGTPYRSFAKLQSALGERADDVAFAMNAGMFDEQGHAIGLLVEDGEQLHRINRRGGGGNFGLLPNGVFLVRDDGSAEVVETSDYEPADNVRFASQSGPMLVIDGRLHPEFDHDGRSRHIRNGVGIGPDGTPLFVISEDVVSFGKFGRLFRDELKANNALYFDGAVSSLSDPANGQQDSLTELGPMVVAFRSGRGEK